MERLTRAGEYEATRALAYDKAELYELDPSAHIQLGPHAPVITVGMNDEHKAEITAPGAKAPTHWTISSADSLGIHLDFAREYAHRGMRIELRIAVETATASFVLHDENGDPLAGEMSMKDGGPVGETLSLRYSHVARSGQQSMTFRMASGPGIWHLLRCHVLVLRAPDETLARS